MNQWCSISSKSTRFISASEKADSPYGINSLQQMFSRKPRVHLELMDGSRLSPHICLGLAHFGIVFLGLPHNFYSHLLFLLSANDVGVCE